MGLKFNGVYKDKLRWYDTELGNVKEVDYTYDTRSEIEFSRKVLKTKPFTMEIHPDHKPDKDGYWFLGYQTDIAGRITFTTGTKNKIIISKDDVDFMFCSTNQSFRSCFHLDVGGKEQLIKLQETDNIFIAFVTQEDAEFEWQEKKYLHPKMSGRAFLFVSPDGTQVCCGRPYGKNGFELRDAIRRFCPNGLSVGWKLSHEQQEVQGIEYDNFALGFARHDKYDQTFDPKYLYDDTSKIKYVKE